MLLSYPRGAPSVQCALCQHITQVRELRWLPNHIPHCRSWRHLNLTPIWHALMPVWHHKHHLRNLSCVAVMQVPVYRHVICGNCSIMLMYPDGAESVKCSVCHFVTGVAHSRWAGGQPPQQQPKPETVVVENPPTLDEQGNEVCMRLL